MSGCSAFGSGHEPGLAIALRQSDCLATQGGHGMFERLFGLDGALGSALTIALTLYVAWLAIGLLTGRSTLRLSDLTPRMLAVGMVLTFATSWIAYQTVVWSLLTGAPDQIAGALLGAQGSATQQFAVRLDSMFTAISSAAQTAAGGAPGPAAAAAAATVSPGAFTASNMLWASALLLLFGSLGVLLVARIALTVLLGLGPVFILCGLFGGTRGLLDGWIKAAVMFSITQLLAVLIGGEALALLAPVVRRIAMAGGAPSMHDAILMLLASGVFGALMGIALKAAATIVSGWRPTATRPAYAEPAQAALQAAAIRQGALAASAAQVAAQTAAIGSDQGRISGVVTAISSTASAAAAVRSIGVTTPAMRDRPAIILPHQTVVAHNRRSGDRLRETATSRSAAPAGPARTFFE